MRPVDEDHDEAGDTIEDVLETFGASCTLRALAGALRRRRRTLRRDGFEAAAGEVRRAAHMCNRLADRLGAEE